jgi:hypothetical protein
VQQTQALALLMLSPSQSISPEALDGEVGDVSEPLPLKSEGVLRIERRDEALECLNALGSANEKSHSKEVSLCDMVCSHPFVNVRMDSQSILLARAHYAYALGNPSECLSLLSQVDFTSFEVRTGITPLQASSQAPATVSSMPTGESATSNIEPVLFRTVSASGSMGVGSTTRHLEVESAVERTWRITEMVRGKCEEGEYPFLFVVLSKSMVLSAHDQGCPTKL